MTMTRARRLWTAFEIVHVPVYFAPEAIGAFTALGLRGYWRTYYAGRVAPLGAVGPDTVVPIFHGFAPSHVSRALPGIWDIATPDQALAAREAGVHAVLVSAWADLGDEVAVAAPLLRRAVDGADFDGRPLGAANVALGWADEPIQDVWTAATVLREARGDGHVNALRDHGVDGCESLVLKVGMGTPREVLQPIRGWTDEEWDDAAGRLRERGWLDVDGVITEAGRAVEASVESRTDELADSPWQVLGDEETERAYAALRALAEPLRHLVPQPNPMILPDPAD